MIFGDNHLSKINYELFTVSNNDPSVRLHLLSERQAHNGAVDRIGREVPDFCCEEK